MSGRQKCMLLFAALLLLGAALLPGLHQLQHARCDEAVAQCGDHGPSGAFEPGAAVDDDCSLCVQLRHDRQWHGGSAAVFAALLAPAAALDHIVLAAPLPPVLAPFRARAPPRLLGC